MNGTTPKILFVDDDPNVLKSLQKVTQDEDWSCHFLTSSREALGVLQSETIDLVVSDVMMPDMDGVQLATEIHNLYPGVVRIFLTGYASQEYVVKALVEGAAQQIIPKPWNDQELKEIIRSALRQCTQQKKHSLEFQNLINSAPLLPALPESYSNVRSCIVGEEVNIEKMADFISQDTSISTALLHWANSALFGQRFQVDTIKKSIIVLGTDIVENLILSESVSRTLAAKNPRIIGFDIGQFKKHAMATAVISRLLIKSLHCTDIARHDRAFVAGLLHDMGKLAAASFFPDRFEKAIARASRKKCPLSEAEISIYGTQHEEIGSFLAEWWSLPPFIVNAAHWHHQPQATPIEQDVIAATYAANLLSYEFGYGSNGDTCPREIADEYRNKFYLTEEAIEILRAETVKTLQALAH